MSEEEITIRDLRNRLTETLTASSSSGTTFVVTRFGRPIATIGPYQMDPPDASAPSRRRQALPLSVGDETSQVASDDDPFT